MDRKLYNFDWAILSYFNIILIYYSKLNVNNISFHDDLKKKLKEKIVISLLFLLCLFVLWFIMSIENWSNILNEI